MARESPKAAKQFEERHYTVKELAAMWRLSSEFVRQLVQHEPGVTEWVRQSPEEGGIVCCAFLNPSRSVCIGERYKTLVVWASDNVCVL